MADNHVENKGFYTDRSNFLCYEKDKEVDCESPFDQTFETPNLSAIKASSISAISQFVPSTYGGRFEARSVSNCHCA